MKFVIALLVMGILTQNFTLAKFLGICPFLGVSKKLNTAVGMSLAVIFVMLLATAVTYPLNMFLEAHDLAYLQTIVFILVIAALVQMVEIVLKKYVKSLYNALGIYLPLITTNCAVLGVVILNIDNISIIEAEPNAISNINVEKAQDNNYYDLMGRKYTQGNLPAGIYIHAGKKVVIK